MTLYMLFRRCRLLGQARIVVETIAVSQDCTVRFSRSFREPLVAGISFAAERVGIDSRVELGLFPGRWALGLLSFESV
jgi:hypothetical protein